MADLGMLLRHFQFKFMIVSLYKLSYLIHVYYITIINRYPTKHTSVRDQNIKQLR